jgi:hypothetical protein
MTTFYSEPNPGNALASENKSRQPFRRTHFCELTPVIVVIVNKGHM